MWTRREVMMGTALGRMTALDTGGAQTQTMDSAQLAGVVQELGAIRRALTTLADGADLPSPIVGKVRDQMVLFLRASGKFPDYIEVGSAVFYQFYDWHVKNGHPLTTARQPDGRYTLQFMFTQMILRPDADPGYVGPPYDNR